VTQGLPLQIVSALRWKDCLNVCCVGADAADRRMISSPLLISATRDQSAPMLIVVSGRLRHSIDDQPLPLGRHAADVGHLLNAKQTALANRPRAIIFDL
jgi:hypothetical protein